MRMSRTVAGVALTTLSAGLLATIPATAAHAISTGLVISEVYPGGGNSGATYNTDYIELYNRGTTPIRTLGLSIQYASNTGTGQFGGTASQLTELPSVTVPPGGYLLVHGASGNTGANLPAGHVDDSPISMGVAGGKVALVTGTDGLGCNGGSTACNADQLARVIDLVGYGNANFFEGTATAPATTTNASSIQRAQGGDVDTDQNRADFATAAADPDNTVTLPPPGAPTEATIAEVQGAGARSPLVGKRVVVEGVVTGAFQEDGQYGGFFIQSVTADTNPLTSDAIRVVSSSSTVAVGDLVRVTGPVAEAASSDSVYSGSETQLGAASTIEGLGTADVPDPVELLLPFPATANGTHGQERYEGLRVTVPAGLIATDLYTAGRFGEISLTTGELLRIPSTAAENAANDADRILIDDGLSWQNLDVLPYTVDEAGTTLPRAGDALAEPVTGNLSYAFGFYRVEPTVGTTAGFERRNPRTAAPDAVGGDVQVASFNVLNYFTDLAVSVGDEEPYPRGANTPEELERQQAKLVSAITALDADVVGLIEMANDDGDALGALVDALNAAQPEDADDYTAVQVSGLNEANPLGGTFGTDAIRTAIIYRSAVVTPAGDPVTASALINPQDEEFNAQHPEEDPQLLFDRPPTVQTFTPVGSDVEFTVVVNHLKSKGSTNDQCGPPDPFGGNCDDLRERQAAGILDLVAALDTDNALLLGDFNAYEEEAPVDVIRDGGFVSTEASLPDADRYSYSFDGEFGTLDYIFASSGLAGAVTDVDIWHINSAESPAYDYNDFNQESLYAPDPHASSDHDPALVGLELNARPVADAGRDQTVRVDRNVTLDASGSTDDGGDLTYAWDLDGDGAFDDATGVTVQFGEDLPPGYYTVAVQVSDGAETHVDTALVTILTPNGLMPPGRP